MPAQRNNQPNKRGSTRSGADGREAMQQPAKSVACREVEARQEAEAEAPEDNRGQNNKVRRHHRSRGAGDEEQNVEVQVNGRQQLDERRRRQ